MNTRRTASGEAYACFICGTVHATGDKIAEADGRQCCPAGCAAEYESMAPDAREDMGRCWGGRVAPEVQHALASVTNRGRAA